MGDNLSNSTDSRAYGPVSGGLILGRVFARVRGKLYNCYWTSRLGMPVDHRTHDLNEHCNVDLA
jgi:hypothetical protein